MLDKQLWQKYRIKKQSLKGKSIVVIIWVSFFYVHRNSDKCDKNNASEFKRQIMNFYGRIKKYFKDEKQTEIFHP